MVEGWSRQRLRRVEATALAVADRARVSALNVVGFRSRYVDTSVGRMHALIAEGSGPLPPVVLLHGLSATAADYGPLLRRLRGVARAVVAPDLAGHGLSEAPSAAAARDALRIGLRESLAQLVGEPSLLFGNSLGGLAAIRYAGVRPDHVAGLMLVSPGGAPTPHDELEPLLAGFRVDGFAQGRAFMERVLARPHWGRHVLGWGASVRLRRPIVRELLDTHSPGGELSPGDLAGLEMPVLMLWGSRERILPDSHREFFTTHLPEHAVIEIAEGFGHAPFIDRPRAVAERIIEFGRQLRTGG